MRSDPNIGVAATTMQQQSSGGESSEDMLELALRMATEMPEEGSLEIEAVRERMASHPGNASVLQFICKFIKSKKFAVFLDYIPD